MPASGRLRTFLVFVALLQFTFPVTLHGRVWAGAYMILYAGMILFGVLLLRTEWTRVGAIFALGATFLGFALWVVFEPTRDAALLGKFISFSAFQLVLMSFLLRLVFRRGGTGGADLIFAAVAVYLLLGSLFAAGFSTLEVLQPGSFVDTMAPDEPVAWQQLMYFSFVTMATLGYGEVLALTAWARSLAILETVAGTLFLTTVIARLVGAYVAPHSVAGAAPAARAGERDAP